MASNDDEPELPVIRGEAWFDTDGKPFTLRVEYPLTFDEMVAAIYGTADLADFASDEDLCGSVAVTLSLEGLPGLSARVSKLRHAEGDGSIESAVFLATCRQRVAELLAYGQAAWTRLRTDGLARCNTCPEMAGSLCLYR